MKSSSAKIDAATKGLRCDALKHPCKRGVATRIFFAATTLAVAAGCSGQSSPSATANPLGSDYKGPPTPCDKELSPSDVADIIAAPISINHYSMAAGAPGEGCEFGSGSGAEFIAFIDIAAKKTFVNIGTAKTSAERFADLSSAAIHPARKPLVGVGDEAYDFGNEDSNMPNAKDQEVMARKGAVICIATLTRHEDAHGDKAVLPKNGDEIAKKLGGLCNKVFAARS